MKKKADDLNVPFDMSDEAIERRWRDVAQLHHLGMQMKTAKHTGRKVSNRQEDLKDK